MLINEVARENIKKYRKMAKMSQKEFAEALGVTHSSVSAWENGKNSIDLNRLGQMAQILNVPLYEIIFEDKSFLKFEEDEETKKINEILRNRPEIKELINLSINSRYRDIVIVKKLLEELKTR